MAGNNTPLAPHYTHQPTSVRRAYIQNLTDLLHVCLLRRDTVRARRAWSILIRCREIDWRSRWYWGLECLNAAAAIDSHLGSTSQPEYEGREVERWLKGVRVSAREVDKPSLLHALVLHLIKHERFRQALDELETYLTSYPYLLSGPLHTYAGLLCFYLAQPATNLASNNPSTTTTLDAGHQASQDRRAEIDSAHSDSSRSEASTTRRPTKIMEPPNPILIRQARAYFVKALSIDETDPVAGEFIEHIDHPEQARARSTSAFDRSRDEDAENNDGEGNDDNSHDGKENDLDDGSLSEDSGTDLEALIGEVSDDDDM